MSLYLGVDTSNYTTSAAAFDDVSGCVFQQKQLLPVKEGERGLRQSDAVFHHTKQLSRIISQLISHCGRPDVIAASFAPCDAEGSYMPCFLVGLNTAECMASACGASFYSFSHQAGHVAAALYSSGRTELVSKRFIAFHVSGGTTQALLVEPDPDKVFKISLVGKSLDLNAGQAIDRVGVAMGLSFPAGAQLESLALRSDKRFSPKVFVRGGDCSLSGVENQCARMLASGASKYDAARLCIDSIACALEKMTENILEDYGSLPLVFAGGVMSNSIIKERLSSKFGAFFAEPEFSADNAAGIAYLAYLKERLDA